MLSVRNETQTPKISTFWCLQISTTVSFLLKKTPAAFSSKWSKYWALKELSWRPTQPILKIWMLEWTPLEVTKASRRIRIWTKRKRCFILSAKFRSSKSSSDTRLAKCERKIETRRIPSKTCASRLSRAQPRSISRLKSITRVFTRWSNHTS